MKKCSKCYAPSTSLGRVLPLSVRSPSCSRTHTRTHLPNYSLAHTRAREHTHTHKTHACLNGTLTIRREMVSHPSTLPLPRASALASTPPRPPPSRHCLVPAPPPSAAGSPPAACSVARGCSRRYAERAPTRPHAPPAAPPSRWRPPPHASSCVCAHACVRVSVCVCVCERERE